jgi:hypothetical protein
MNALLRRALAEVEQLPDAAQESIASLILQEIQDERGWDERFAASQDLLERLAAEAEAEIARS